MLHRIARVAVFVAASGGALGCSNTAPHAGFTVEAATKFQTELVHELRGPDSPRSVVDAEYLSASQRVVLGREGRTVVRDGGEQRVTLEVDATGLHCRAGCPQEVAAFHPIDAPQSFAWGPLTLRIAPQPVNDGPGGRVLVMDPKAPAMTGPDPSFFPVDAAFIVRAKFEPGEGDTTALTTSRGVSKPFAHVGELRFELAGASATLQAFRGTGQKEGPLLVPFTDPSNDTTTYPVGRYLEVDLHDDGATLDFNRATNPWCAYSPHFNCPVPPKDNELSTPITAGERRFSDH